MILSRVSMSLAEKGKKNWEIEENGYGSIMCGPKQLCRSSRRSLRVMFEFRVPACSSSADRPILRLVLSLDINAMRAGAALNNWPLYFPPFMSNNLLQYLILRRGMFLSRCVHPCRASPLTLLRYLGIVFLAILCNPRHILLLLRMCG
jgi:hypothetical protein